MLRCQHYITATIVNFYEPSCLVCLQHCPIGEILAHEAIRIVYGFHFRANHHYYTATVQRHFADFTLCFGSLFYILKMEGTP